MAGSYRHIVDSKNNFIGVDLLDDLGDAHEALEECYEMIKILSGEDLNKIFEANRQYVATSNPEYAGKMTAEEFWGKDENEHDLDEEDE